MSFVDLQPSASRLKEAVDTVNVHWEHARSTWNDAASRGFEEKHLAEIAPTVASALEAIRRFNNTLQRAARECECD